MNPDLEKLIDLQRTENELKRAQEELSQIPVLRADSERRLAEERTRVETAKEGLAESQKVRRQEEGALQDLEQKRSRYKGQLMEVKTNKEYTAMLHEIEGVEREIRAREDQILVEMERAETLTAEVKREEQEFKEAQQQHDTEAREIAAREKSAAGEVARLQAEGDAIAATLPEDVLDLFKRVVKLRGTGLAEAREESCQECHVKFRLQMFVDIRKNEEIVQCPSCNRILYYEPPPPTVVPEL
jgi:uncharacterized protein